MGVNLFFFLKKSDDLFCHRPLQSDDLFSCRLLTTPIRLRRLSSVLYKFSHKKINFRSGVTPPPGGCHPERFDPRPLVTPSRTSESRRHTDEMYSSAIRTLCPVTSDLEYYSSISTDVTNICGEFH